MVFWKYKVWLGDEWVRLYLDKDSEVGSGRQPRERPVLAELRVGLNGSWEDVLDTLIHELLEWVLQTQMMVCFSNKAQRSTTGNGLMVMTHDQFQEAVSRVSPAVALLYKDIRKAWKCAKQERDRSKS